MMREFEIERQFQIKIDIIKANKGIYYIKTNKGERCLKKINYGPQKLLFVYGAKEHLIKNGFKTIDRYFLNIDGEPYALVNEDLYTLSEWLEGRECDFHNIEDVKIAARTLAKLHEASKGYDPPENSKLKTDLGRWPTLMAKRVKSLDKMRDMVRKKNNKSSFDLLYIKSLDFYKKIGKEALKTLEESEYEALCAVAENEKGFCHHDYTYHNIIIGQDNEISVIDFDYCILDTHIHDLASLLIRAMKDGKWSDKTGDLIINSYQETLEVTDEELKIMKYFIMFPQSFWQIGLQYYWEQQPWNEEVFINKIIRYLEDVEYREVFLDEYFK